MYESTRFYSDQLLPHLVSRFTTQHLVKSVLFNSANDSSELTLPFLPCAPVCNDDPPPLNLLSWKGQFWTWVTRSHRPSLRRTMKPFRFRYLRLSSVYVHLHTGWNWLQVEFLEFKLSMYVLNSTYIDHHRACVAPQRVWFDTLVTQLAVQLRVQLKCVQCLVCDPTEHPYYSYRPRPRDGKYKQIIETPQSMRWHPWMNKPP